MAGAAAALDDKSVGALERSIFSGEHTLKRKRGSEGGALAKFVKQFASARCLGCNAALSKGEAAVCAGCAPQRAAIYMALQRDTSEVERASAALWSNCARCQADSAGAQGSLCNAVQCANDSCPAFYVRHEKAVQADRLRAKLSAFDALDW